jgi:hypothetical protein
MDPLAAVAIVAGAAAAIVVAGMVAEAGGERRCQVPGARFQVPGFRCRVSEVRSQKSGARRKTQDAFFSDS